MRAVVLLSGGLDSTVALALAREQYAQANGELIRLLTVDYGQRAAMREITAATRIAEYYGLPHEIIALPWMAGLLPTALRPGQTSPDAEAAMDVRQVWVPNRNGVLLNLAAAYAEALDADTVVFGANLEEGADFPDNTPAFREAINQSLAYSTLSRVQVRTPVETFDKTRIILEGVRVGAPLHLVWSCYEAGEIHCGVCASCQRLKQALGQAKAQGHPLPTVPFAA